MIVSELDRWRTASELIRAHGANAGYEAGLLGMESVMKGDPDGLVLWFDIAFKVQELERRFAAGNSENDAV